jgi:acyl-CoA thioesterase-1
MRKNLYLVFLLALAALAAAACGASESRNVSNARAENAAAPPAPTPTPETSLPKIVAFGDSLTEGLGLPAGESYPAVLQKMLDADGYRYEVVNAGVSGETSAGGLRRLDWTLAGDVRFVILELGGNDLMRGQPVKGLKNNLAQIIESAKSRNIEVLLAGMYAPTNAGMDYQREVHEAFQQLAREYKVTLIPFFLDRVAGIESLNQRDGIHPNAQGARIVAETVYKSLRPLLDKRKQ